MIHTGRGRPGRPGPLFLEGETVATADGLKLVAGLAIDTEIGPQFVCGGLVDMGEDKGSKFVPGQVGDAAAILILNLLSVADAWWDQKRSSAVHPWPDG